MVYKNKASQDSFLGRGWAFPVQFSGQAGSVEMAGRGEDIEQSLKILLETLPGERVTNLNYGCKVKDIIFHPIDGKFEFLAKEAIQDAINYYEPRIILDDIEFDFKNQNNGVVLLELDYIVKLTNARQNLVYPFSKIEANI